MRFVSTLALALSIGLGTMSVVAAPVASAKEKPAEAGKITLSKPLMESAVKIQDAVKAKDWAAAKQLLLAAQPSVSSEDDKYWFAQQQLNVGIQLKDPAMQRPGIEGVLASGKANPADLPALEFYAGQFALQAKEYDPAIAHLTKATQLNYPGSSAYLLLAEAHFQKATAAGTNMSPENRAIAAKGVPYIKQAIEAEKAAGKPVPPEWVARGFSFASVLGLPDAPEWSMMNLRAAPTGQNWRAAIITYQNGHKDLTRGENLDLSRLLYATNGLTSPNDYGEYADAALKSGVLGEVIKGIEKGRSSGVLSGTQLADYYSQAQSQVARDKADLPAAERDAAKAANGAAAVATGDALMGYGEYAKAVTLYNLALTKGGVDADEVNSRLGIALTQSGDMAGAKAAFAKVTKPNRKAIANFWTVYIDTKSGAAAPATTGQ